jgi:hypothetical protein
MSDRGVFVAAFLTVGLIVAGAFVLPQFFFFELAKSSIYIAIGVLVFFGEGRYSYMLGIIAPLLWILVDLILGGLFREFNVLSNYLLMRDIPPLSTPLHAVERLAAILLFILSLRAWRKEVPEKFFGKTFQICAGISLAYAVVLGVWYTIIV